MKTLILILLLAVTVYSQQTNPRSIAEIDASIVTIQSVIDDLNAKKAALQQERLKLTQPVATVGNQQSAEGDMAVVVRVSGERSVVLLVDDHEREVFLAGLFVKLGWNNEAKALLKRSLSQGIAFAKCADANCFEVELFATRGHPSVNCQLIEAGLAQQTRPDLCALSNTTVVAQPVDGKDATSGPAPSSSRAPGTDVHVRGYYRKDGTYVRPHTRSAPRRKNNHPQQATDVPIDWQPIKEMSGEIRPGVQMKTYGASIARNGDRVKVSLRIHFPQGAPADVFRDNMPRGFDVTSIEYLTGRVELDCVTLTVKPEKKSGMITQFNGKQIKTKESAFQIAEANIFAKYFCERGSKPIIAPTLKP